MARKPNPEISAEAVRASDKPLQVPQTRSILQTKSSSGGRVYVYSTLANKQDYIDWEKGGADMKARRRIVSIEGGTGVMSRKMLTPLGVATEISDEDAAFLERNTLFKIHAQQGFVTIQRAKADPEKVASDMNLADPSSPKTPVSYADAGANAAKPKE